MEKDIKKQYQIIKQGLVDIFTTEAMDEKLKKSIAKKEPLRIKYGVDPTAPDLHLGHAVPLRKLKQLQDLGHEVILLIGDFTARIGDPSGRSSTRPQLTEEEVQKNAETYTNQAFKILDKEKTTLDYNSRWLSPLKFEEIVKLTSYFTVARLLERDDFNKRYQNEVSISLHEFLYPVMQAYDSIALNADIELGGTDQIFNLLAGRELQKAMGQEPQVCITTPILEGTDGNRKMSKSYGNHIGLTDIPEEMFGKIMSISDDLMLSYYQLASNLSVEEINKIEKRLKEDSLHPVKAKRDLAKNIISIYHSHEDAEEAEKIFDAKHKKSVSLNEGETSNLSFAKEAKLDDIILDSGDKIWIIKLITNASQKIGMDLSGNEARRLVEQKGIRIDNKTIDSVEEMLDFRSLNGKILQIGKRQHIKLITK